MECRADGWASALRDLCVSTDICTAEHELNCTACIVQTTKPLRSPHLVNTRKFMHHCPLKIYSFIADFVCLQSIPLFYSMHFKHSLCITLSLFWGLADSPDLAIS